MADSVQIWTEMPSWSYLTLLAVESSLYDQEKVIDNLIRFPES